jgi:hypothetical protein
MIFSTSLFPFLLRSHHHYGTELIYPEALVAVAAEARPRRIGAAFLLVRKSGGLLGAALTALHWPFDGGTGHDQYRRLN